jgi:hypothetical protein
VARQRLHQLQSSKVACRLVEWQCPMSCFCLDSAVRLGVVEVGLLNGGAWDKQGDHLDMSLSLSLG